jgi:hypothetical protein
MFSKINCSIVLISCCIFSLPVILISSGSYILSNETGRQFCSNDMTLVNCDISCEVCDSHNCYNATCNGLKCVDIYNSTNNSQCSTENKEDINRIIFGGEILIILGIIIIFVYCMAGLISVCTKNCKLKVDTREYINYESI